MSSSLLMTPHLVHRSIRATLCLTGRNHGIRMKCFWLRDENFLRKQHLFKRCSPTISQNSSLGIILLSEVHRTCFPSRILSTLRYYVSVAHESELALLFGPVPTPVENDFANKMLDFYINFINDLNPGGMVARFSFLVTWHSKRLISS